MPTATASTWLPFFSPATTVTTSAITKTSIFKTSRKMNRGSNQESTTSRCKASNTSMNKNLNLDLDLYDLMGIDSRSDQSQIKTAYRMLQKRCHPDIAGPEGHEMAIILNDAYSVLSDPISRSAYDKEHSKIAELRGYTGKPLHSVWLGSESEERAVFVDEVKCVGCLKCALFAQNTFAIESVYGRARVVAQWADPEHKIHDAIQACPVDCISMVERSDLAALEYLMSKQPRGNVRVGTGNSAGTRVSNIFVDVKKFQTKFVDSMNKSARKETDINWEARISAIQAIRSISNWLYWQSRTSEANQTLTYSSKKSEEPNIKKLRDAAAARKLVKERTKTIHTQPSHPIYHDEYWIPSTQALPASTSTHINLSSQAASKSPNNEEWKKTNNKNYRIREENRRSPIALGIPVVMATIAAAIVRMQASQGLGDGLKEHIGGSLALEIVNSSWLPVILAGITWYYIGVMVVELIEVIGNGQE